MQLKGSKPSWFFSVTSPCDLFLCDLCGKTSQLVLVSATSVLVLSSRRIDDQDFLGFHKGVHMSSQKLDCKGLQCPIPIVRISRAMKELKVGEQLYVEASDISFQADVEAWVRSMGHHLVSFSEEAGIQTAVLEKRL